MNEPLQQPQVSWPFWDRPFARTARGYLCWRETYYRAFYVALCAALLVTPYCLINQVGEEAWQIGAGVAAAAALLFYFLLFILPILPVIREARAAHASWRQAWLRFEQDSVAFQQTIRAQGFNVDDAYAQAPSMPAWTYKIYHQSEDTFPFAAVDGQEPIAVIDQALSAVICELVQIGGAVFVGKSDGRELLAIVPTSSDSQFWVRLNYASSGASLVPRLHMGLQSWSNRFEDAHGRRYPGDMVKIKTRHILSDAWMAVCFAIPALNLVLLFLVLKEAFGVNRAKNFRVRLFPQTGDAADPVIWANLKEAIGGSDAWVTPTKEWLASVQALKIRFGRAVEKQLRAARSR